MAKKDKEFKIITNIKILFNNLYYKRKYNTLKIKYQVSQDEKIEDKKEIINLQKKYIFVLEKSSTLGKDLKEVKLIINEMNERKK